MEVQYDNSILDASGKVKMRPSRDTDRLGFDEAVVSEFEFLSRFGFHCVFVGSTIVRFESNCAFVDVYHGRTSYVINVRFGLHAKSTMPSIEQQGIRKSAEFVIGRSNEEFTVSIWDIARFRGAPDVDERTFLQASTPESVRIVVSRLGDLVRRYAEPLLRCDEAFFHSLEEWQIADASRAGKAWRLREVRAELVEEWKKKNYRAVVDLLEPVVGEITPAERTKLEYARKHLK